jgi:hypothetical protein
LQLKADTQRSNTTPQVVRRSIWFGMVWMNTPDSMSGVGNVNSAFGVMYVLIGQDSNI